MTTIEDYIARAKETFKLLEDALSVGDIKLDYVIRTGFISWLNQEDSRIERYLTGTDIPGLVLEYIDEITEEDRLTEDEMETDVEEDNSNVRQDE